MSVSGFLPVAKSENTPIHRTAIQETIPRANLPPTSRTSKCRASGCQPSPLLWNGRSHPGFGSPGGVWSVWFLFSAGRKTYSHHVQGSTTVDIYIPSFEFMIGLSLDVFAFFDKRVAFEEVRTVHVCESPFHIVELLLWSFHAFVSCIMFCS